MRANAAKALEQMNSEKALELLIIAFKDESKYMRHKVIETLGKNNLGLAYRDRIREGWAKKLV